MKLQERYEAAFIGCAIGDALGMPVEGFKRAQIHKYVGKVEGFMPPIIVRDTDGNKISRDEFGKLGYYTDGLEKGEWTDDTISFLLLGESLGELGRFDLEDIARRRIEDYTSRLSPEGVARGGFGQTTKLGFENVLRGISPYESGVVGGPGNAPAMMMGSLGVYMHATGEYGEGVASAELVAKMTHLDPRSVAGGVVQAHAMYAVLNDMPQDTFVNSLVDICRKYERPATAQFSWHGWGSLLARLEWIRDNKDATPEDAYLRLTPSSTAYSSHPFALFMFQKYGEENPVKGLLETINYGGDCDTTGAIYGSLIGGKNGLIFPETWKQEVKGRERLQQAGDRLYQLRLEHAR